MYAILTDNMEKYLFEIYCIEPQDISNEIALQSALSFSAQLWEQSTPIQKEIDGLKAIHEPEADITIKILPVDTKKIWTGDIEVAFILKVECSNFEVLDLFRSRLLKHCRDTLRFKHKRILRDDISAEICNKLYPEINSVEIQLRRYLIKFFIQKIGLKWWELTADNNMTLKVSSRKKDRKDSLADFIDTDVEYIDFNELGELIYKQSTGFNQPEKILSKIVEINTVEELDKFKSELDGNYTKYFKKYFKEKNFEQKWSILTRIRNKVAHQGSFHNSELIAGFDLARSIKDIISEAENEIDTLVLSIDEKEAIRNTAIENLEQEILVSDSSDENSSTQVGNIELLEELKNKTPDKMVFTQRGHKVISENELLNELELAEREQAGSYVGLKWFVTSFLAEKGYSYGFSYSLINILIDKGLIELYVIKSFASYEINAIRLKK